MRFKNWVRSVHRPTTSLRRSVVLGRVERLEDRTVPATFTVDTLAEGSDATDGKTSLREALDTANTASGADAIVFAAGLGGKTITLAAGNGNLMVRDAVTITGPAGGLTIDAAKAFRVFDVNDQTTALVVVTLSGLTLTNGKNQATNNGGAIQNAEDLTLTNCTLTANSSPGGSGGAISNTGILTISASTINNNTASGDGGGIINRPGGMLTVTNSTITGNIAGGNGGGIDSMDGSVSVTNSTVSNNTAGVYGGGLIFDGTSTTATISGSKVNGNTAAASGGGIWTRANQFSLSTSTVSGNTGKFCGGVYVYDKTAVIDRTTISNNSSSTRVAGIFANSSTDLTLTNSTVSGNTSGGSAGGLLVYYGTATVFNSTFSGNAATGIGGGIQNFGTLTASHLTITGNRADSDDNGGEIGGGFATATGTCTVTNSIIAGNFTGSGTTPSDVRAKIDVSNNNLFGDPNSAGGQTNGVNGNIVGVDVATVLSPTPANNGGPTLTYMLLAGSPAVGAGTKFGVPAADQRGFVRPADPTFFPDLGAVELQLITISPATLPSGTTGVAYSQTFTATAPGLPAGTTFTFAAAGNLPPGLTLTPAGKLSGTPTATGGAAFGVLATASTNDFGGANYTVTISAPNGLPVPVNDATTTAFNSATTVSVLANDSDPDGDVLTVTGTSTPTNGKATVNLGKTVTYTPNTGFSGSDSFTYTVSDGKGGTATATVAVTVNGQGSQKLLAVSDIASAVTATATVIDVLANDTAINGGTLTITATGLAANGTITINGGKSVTYTSKAAFVGNDSFTYTIMDGVGGTATATVTVSVRATPPVNTPPVAGNDTATTLVGTATTVNVLANDTDANGDTLTVTGASTPANGKATFTAANVTYTPNAGFAGNDSFTYTVSDGKGGTATGTVTVTVTSVILPGGPRVELVGFREFAAGSDRGTAAAGQLFNPDGTQRFSSSPFGGFTGGVRTAAADFNGDGVADLVLGTGPGRATQVQVLDGKTQAQLFTVDPFEAAFTGGVFVTCGDLTGDGRPELIITPDEGGGPRVDVYSGNGFGKAASFFGIDDPNFRGGARASTGDMNADGRADLIVVAGFGGGPRVAGFDGKSVGGSLTRLFGDFFAFEQTLRNGIFVTVGDLNGDGNADLICGGGPGGGPRVLAFSGQPLLTNTQTVLANFFAGNPDSRGGVRLTVKNLDGDNRADLVVGDGTGAGSRVISYLGRDISSAGTPATGLNFDAFAGFTGGVFVG